MSEPVVFRDIIVVGGGCYGSFYAEQLRRARANGAAEWQRLLIVDRDSGCRAAHLSGGAGGGELRVQEWDAFFDEYLGAAAASEAPDAIVPSPLMPHLMFEWLLRAARRRWPGRLVARRSAELASGLPYDVLHADGTRYVSFADWLCPVHCVEPATCPVTRGPRTWEMSDALAGLTEQLGRTRAVRGPVLFVCRHRAYGVGMFDVAEVLAGDAAVAAAGAAGVEVDVVVGTVSSCHGAVSLLRLGGHSAGALASSPYIPA
ncbi:MAG: hypothetical protein ACREOF_16240 [Gemmatimonadales bacterium]